MSDSVRPHRRQHTRLPRPWDSPGKNTGVGCHCLLQCMKVKSESEVAQLCLTLSDLMDCSLPGSSVHGIFQARVLEWGAIAFSNNDRVKIRTQTPESQVVFFFPFLSRYNWHTTLYKFKVNSMIIWFTYIMKQFPQYYQWTSIVSWRYKTKEKNFSLYENTLDLFNFHI